MPTGAIYDIITMLCRCDGIGRRSGLKIHRWRHRAGSSPATGTITSEEASTVPFPPRGENCTMLASSTYDGYSVSFGEGEWKNGERGKEHLPPDPSYKMSWEPVIGAGLVVICTVGIIAVAADDLTGVGVADDFLFGPLGAGVGEGLIMIFG